MRPARFGALAIAAAVALLASGCGERPQVVSYKQGTYQGKPDTPPYAGSPWDGNQQKWDNAIAVRQQNQNEYKRTN